MLGLARAAQTIESYTNLQIADYVMLIGWISIFVLLANAYLPLLKLFFKVIAEI